MTIRATEHDNYKHPMLGKLMQYSITHYGKFIPTDYPKEQLGNVSRSSPGSFTERDLARHWLTPQANRFIQHPWYGDGGERNRRFMEQDPWCYGMPHMWAPEIAHANAIAFNWQLNVDSAVKYLLTPVRALTFASVWKLNGKVLGTMNYLQCMVTDPSAESTGRPLAILWCRDEWLEPFRSKSYRDEAVEDLTAAARAKIAQMRSR